MGKRGPVRKSTNVKKLQGTYRNDRDGGENPSPAPGIPNCTSFLKGDGYNDKGYVTVTPDYELKVSKRLETEFQSGKVYYAMEGRKIWLPDDGSEAPDKANLDYHLSEVFLK